MVESIAAQIFNHRLVTDEQGRSVCKCGWYIVPLLDSIHRLHVAESVLTATLMATAQVNAENILEAKAGQAKDIEKLIGQRDDAERAARWAKEENGRLKQALAEMRSRVTGELRLIAADGRTLGQGEIEQIGNVMMTTGRGV